jgi:hypothetical protein
VSLLMQELNAELEYRAKRIAQLERGLREVLMHDLDNPQFGGWENTAEGLRKVIESMRSMAKSSLEDTYGELSR